MQDFTLLLQHIIISILINWDLGSFNPYRLSEHIGDSLDGDSLDENNIAFFIVLQKAFDTVEHGILPFKPSHYGIRGLANDWFKSYLSNRQFVSIYETWGPQGSVLGPLYNMII